jgi:serine/threonine protein kinase
MTTSTQPRDEVFPGYVLTERIGSGGYAEVWRARAPGGIEKAVKIVYGCYDDQLAAQEMKAMERIRDVRHPFVLSLERFEVVDGRLAILTELADMSLEQRAQQCRAQGLPGIPRDELLRYMADTAEALDFLAQRHSLQHLDVKPANLLISGEHVKVADFGLVKELVSRTQHSMVAGLTPTYSSPEMFDDAPSPHSDQYSLAIVYQEMLTGVLPFPGRTAAQLANQHLRSQPQLAALVQADRAAVARALSKNPAERFPSCRDFVRTLIDAVDSSLNPALAGGKTADQDATRGRDNSCSPVTTMPRAVANGVPSNLPVSAANATQPTELPSHGTIDTKAEVPFGASLRPNEDIVDVTVPSVAEAVTPMQPTLYIAIGGVGIRILSRLRDLLAGRENGPQRSSAVQMIAIDTDRDELKNACSTNSRKPLPSTDALCLSLRLPQEYRDQGRHDLEWLSHRWLYNIPRSLETRGYRALGRLALVDHVDQVVCVIDGKLEQLRLKADVEHNPPEAIEVRIVLLVGMGGGTGGGMAIDLANLARSRLQSAGRRGVVECVLVCTCLGNVGAPPLSVANTYALLTELQFVSVFGNQGVQAESSGLQPLESRCRPFDLVYCVPAKRQAHESADVGLSAIARQLSLASIEGVGHMLQSCRQTASPRELVGHDPLLLRSFECTSLRRPMQDRIDRLTAYLARTFAHQWLGDACPSEWRRLDRPREAEVSLRFSSEQEASADSSNVPAVSPTSQAEEWRLRFGQCAQARFVYEIVSRICRQSSLRGAYRSAMLPSTNPVRFVEVASQTLSSISKCHGNSPSTVDPLSDADQAIVDKLASSGNRVLTKLIDAIEQLPPDATYDDATAERIIKSECTAAIEECLSQQTQDDVADPDFVAQDYADQALVRADVNLLQCGYDRRTLIVVPADDKQLEEIDTLTKVRPTAAVVSAEIDESLIICEGSGINPSSFARGLERVYPGIAEAAGRHFTRIDIDWSAWPL